MSEIKLWTASFWAYKQKRSKEQNSCRASGPKSISYNPSMDSKKDGLPPVVHPVLPPGQTGSTVQGAVVWWIQAAVQSPPTLEYPHFWHLPTQLDCTYMVYINNQEMHFMLERCVARFFCYASWMWDIQSLCDLHLTASIINFTNKWLLFLSRKGTSIMYFFIPRKPSWVLHTLQ